MKCDKCSFMNDPDARFCNQCGTALNMVCPQCKNNNAPGSKFCKSCGYSFEQSSDSNVDVRPILKNGTTGKKICPACHTINESTSQFCFKCGIALPQEVSPHTHIVGNPAGFWIRLVAFYIDNLILSIGLFLALLLFKDMKPGEIWGSIFGDKVNWGIQILGIAIYPVYYTFTIGKWGQTVGKYLLGLKVTRVDGSKLTYWRSFARYCSWYLSLLILGIGFIMIALTSQKRGLHDFMCNTRVLKRI